MTMVSCLLVAFRSTVCWKGMCMLTLILEKGKLIMLIKQVLAYRNKSVTLKHFQKQMFDWRGTYQRGNKFK